MLCSLVMTSPCNGKALCFHAHPRDFRFEWKFLHSKLCIFVGPLRNLTKKVTYRFSKFIHICGVEKIVYKKMFKFLIFLNIGPKPNIQKFWQRRRQILSQKHFPSSLFAPNPYTLPNPFKLPPHDDDLPYPFTKHNPLPRSSRHRQRINVPPFVDQLPEGPFIDLESSGNVTPRVGRLAPLNCRVNQIGNRKVSRNSVMEL